MENKTTFAFEERDERELEMVARAKADCIKRLLGGVCVHKNCAKCQKEIDFRYIYARSSSIDQARIDVLVKKHLHGAAEEAMLYRLSRPQDIDFDDDRSIRKFVWRPVKVYLIIVLIAIVYGIIGMILI